MSRDVFFWDDLTFGPRFLCKKHRNWIGHHKQDIVDHLRKDHGSSEEEIKTILEDLYEKLRETSLFHRSLNFEEYFFPFDPEDFNPEKEEDLPYTDEVEPLTEVISVRIGPLLKLTVVDEARRRGVSVSHLVRDFIRKCMFEDEEDER